MSTTSTRDEPEGHDQGGGVPDSKSKREHKHSWWRDPPFVVGFALFLFGGPLNFFSSSPRVLYLGALGVCVLVVYGVHQWVSKLESANKDVREASTTPRLERQPLAPLPAETKPDAAPIPPPKAAAPRKPDPQLTRIEDTVGEIKKNTTPRVPFEMTEERIAKLAAGLDKHPAEKLGLVCWECAAKLMEGFEEAVRRAEWPMERREFARAGSSGSLVNWSEGIHLLFRPDKAEAGAVVRDALKSAGIEFSEAPWRTFAGSTAGVSIVIGQVR